MSEEAAVTLSAEDDITAAVNSSISALKELQASASGSVGGFDSLAQVSGKAGDGISLAGAASQASIIPHRAAHQAMNLVSASMVDMAGSGPAAASAIRVVDSAMFALATGARGASLGFVAVVGAVVGIVSAFKAASDASKKASDELDKMTEIAVKSVSQLNYLNSAQQSVAGVGLSQLYTKSASLKDQIAGLNQKMAENTAKTQQSGVTAGQTGSLWEKLKGDLSLITASYGTTAMQTDQASASQVKMAGQLRVLQNELNQTNTAISNMKQKASEYKSSLEDLGNPLMTFAAGLERDAQAIEKLGRYMNDTEPTLMEWADAGMKASEIMKQAMSSMVAEVTDALATLLVSGTATWDTMFTNMLKTAGAAMKQIGEMWLAMDLMVSLGVGPQSIGAAVALIAAGSIIESVASQITSKATPRFDTLSAAASSATSVDSTVPISAQTGAGGSAVSSAYQTVNNNISVTLAVEALDLSAVSDAQMRSLANRIARLISQGASGGQFSLVGA